MKRLKKLTLVITKCNECPYIRSGVISSWCTHPEMKKDKRVFLVSDSCEIDISDYCPLQDAIYC